MTIRRPRSGRALAVTVLAVATAAAGMTATPAIAAPTGQILLAGGATAVPGSYIVVLKDSAVGGTAGSARAVAAVAGTSSSLAKGYGAKVRRTFGAALNGFEASMTEAAARRMAADRNVAYVEQDHTVSLSATTQTGATWGIDRIDQRNRPLSTTYTYSTTASNVTAYIVDTGIRVTHGEFAGRAVSGFDAVDGGAADDCNGHGTHVAGTVGGSTYGVAKGVKLVAVRVLNCRGSGTNAGVLAGIDWVTRNAVKPAVANMSLGGRASTALDNAVTASINAGVTYALAAGNSNANACSTSPARVPTAITVGATTDTDARASYSNHGTCLDIFAPGSAITSAWSTNDTVTRSVSGTSMASPHVAGAAALILAGNPRYTPQQVRDTMVNAATPGVVTGPGTGSPNRLLFVQ